MINADGWIDQWPNHPAIRRFDPPRNVLVDMDVALGLARISRRADHVTLRVKACAVNLQGIMPARQYAWFQTSSGSWVAVIQVDATSGNGQNRITLDLCVSEDAVSIDELRRDR
ncbi:UNVERIFIED_ORG: hypothetical protein FNL38_11144 [Nocardia globerula]|uniref:Uncharacterized protein n=1 Tax=Nocardia globerula TaxID=1818 RepID=A0A652YI72_NOCGL|nr:hypothetical protein [Nocardia globerula]